MLPLSLFLSFLHDPPAFPSRVHLASSSSAQPVQPPYDSGRRINEAGPKTPPSSPSRRQQRCTPYSYTGKSGRERGSFVCLPDRYKHVSLAFPALIRPPLLLPSPLPPHDRPLWIASKEPSWSRRTEARSSAGLSGRYVRVLSFTPEPTSPPVSRTLPY